MTLLYAVFVIVPFTESLDFSQTMSIASTFWYIRDLLTHIATNLLSILAGTVRCLFLVCLYSFFIEAEFMLLAVRCET